MGVNMKIWYEKQAEDWSQAIPIGNGSMGGLVFGGIENERIGLNLDTLWSGCERDTLNYNASSHLNEIRTMLFNEEYEKAQEHIEKNMLGVWNESYQQLGIVHFQFDNVYKIKNYRRELDLSEAIARVTYEADDACFMREMFVSNPDQVMVICLECNKPQLNFSITMESLLQYQIFSFEKGLVMHGKCPEHVEPNYITDCEKPVVYSERGMEFEVKIYPIELDGEITIKEDIIEVKNASKAVFIVAIPKNCDVIKEYNELRNNHTKDYEALFNRVGLDLGVQVDAPTDQRLENLKNGSKDNALFALYFQYGRYLLISSSRKGAQPANLQGVWSWEIRPAWSANWTTNINIQMNYWPVFSCNLAECFEPYFKFQEDLSKSGQKTAQIHYDCRGFCVHHNVDYWRTTTPSSGKAIYAFWPMAGVWMCRDLWEYYLYYKDVDFLKFKIYPIMRLAVLFCLDWLVEYQGYLVTCPSTSPENEFLTESGGISAVGISSTLDTLLIKEIFDNFLQTCFELRIEDELCSEIKVKKGRLYPYQIGKYGQLQEWSKDFDEPEPGHRHLSHLYGVYPSNEFFKDSKLLTAAERSLIRRLDNSGGHTGWSSAWVANLWARFKRGNNAFKYLKNQLTHFTADNLFSQCNEFTQIDGNFGGTAAISEMLLQSHGDYIELLPALPDEWPEGKVKGLCARGGFVIDIAWKYGKVFQYNIYSVDTFKIKVKNPSVSN